MSIHGWKERKLWIIDTAQLLGWGEADNDIYFFY